MAKIFMCGDPHGQFSHIVSAVDDYRPQAVILLGDQTADRPLHEELASILDLMQIWWIAGNHDTDNEKWYDNLFASKLAHRNLHGRVETIAGVRVGGFAGVVREKTWHPQGTIHDSPEAYLRSCGAGTKWRGGLPLRHRSSIFPSDVVKLGKGTADILVVHEAPKPLHPHGNVAATRLANDLRVRAAFHGHHHEMREYPASGGVWHGVSEAGILMIDTETFLIDVMDEGKSLTWQYYHF